MSARSAVAAGLSASRVLPPLPFLSTYPLQLLGLATPILYITVFSASVATWQAAAEVGPVVGAVCSSVTRRCWLHRSSLPPSTQLVSPVCMNASNHPCCHLLHCRVFLLLILLFPPLAFPPFVSAGGLRGAHPRPQNQLHLQPHLLCTLPATGLPVSRARHGGTAARCLAPSCTALL